MATNYPTSVDTPTDPTGTNTMDGVTGGAGVVHATQHTNINDGMVAVQTAIGTTAARVKQNAMVIDSVVTATTGNILADHYTPCDTTANAITLTLPTAPNDKTLCGYKIVTLGAGHAVVVNTGGSDVFNVAGGVTTTTSTTKGQSQMFQYAHATGIWTAITDGLSLTQLDLRYAPLTGSTTYAPLASPALTGVPTAPTATALTNTTQLASTAYADAAVAVEVSRAETAEALLAPLASPTFTGAPLSTTPAAGDNTTKVATTAFAVTQMVNAMKNQWAYVVSGCVWTADSPASTLNGSMTAGTVCIGGVLVTVNSISAHAFTASQDTYVDVGASGTVAFTGVANNTTSPALASSGTLLNTVRLAIVISTGSALTSTAVSINQGNVRFASATTQLNTTVAAGSNGQTISALTGSALDLASTSGASASGGLAQVNHAATGVYTIQYTGITTNTSLNGVTVISGAGTVSTSDVVTGYLPMNVTDSIGNLIYPTTPYPRTIGASYMPNGYTTTTTTVQPIYPLVTPFVVPAGPSRLVKMNLSLSLFRSSASAATNMIAQVFSDNASTLFATALQTVSVTSDNGVFTMLGIGPRLAAGTYYAQAYANQNGSGTMSVGTTGVASELIVELG